MNTLQQPCPPTFNNNRLTCFTGMLYSVIYGSLCILLVFLGFIWCSSSHTLHQQTMSQIQQMQQQIQQSQQHQNLPNNLQNHRLSPAELSELTLGGSGVGSSARSSLSPTPVIQMDGKEGRMESNVEISNPSSAVRRSYQSSGYGSSDYGSGSQSQYGGQQGGASGQYGQLQQQQQQYGSSGQMGSGTIGRQFDPMSQFGGGGGYGSQMNGIGFGASGYYPSGFGLENRFLSLFPRRSSFYQPYYPYGPFGSSGSYFPSSSPFGGGGGGFGSPGGFGGGGQYGGGGYPGMGGGLGSAFGALGRLAQASSLLTGGLQSYRERLAQSPASSQMMASPMHHYNGEVEGS